MSEALRRLDRVLVLLPSTAIGGAEVHSAVLARALAERGVEVRLGIAAQQRGRFAEMLGSRLASGLEAAPIAWDREAEAEDNIERQAEAAAELIAAARPDAAILPLPWPTHGIGLHRALAEADIPTLAIAHLAPPEPRPGMAEALEGFRPGPTSWVAVSDPVAARLAACLGLKRESVVTVPNGIAVPGFDPVRRLRAREAKRALLGLPPGAPLLLFAGRLEPNKGADLLPGIAEGLRDRAGATLAALGEGPLRHRLAAHAAAAPGGPLRLMGQVEDVTDWLLAGDALLLPSRLEGCPLVFLEAAACRCPVVATEAALEAFGEDAYAMAAMVPDANAASLAERAAASLGEPAAMRRKVEAAWLRVTRHDQAAMLRHYLGLLRATAG